MKKERIVYLDYLRVLAAVAVVMIHVSAQKWSDQSVFSGDWYAMNFYDSIARWAVPVFLMISGALQLSRECSLKKLYSKNILRLVVVYVVWSVLYAVFYQTIKMLNEPDYTVSIISFAKSVYMDRYHLWFIPMMAGVYLLIPVLKQVVENRKVTKYYLLVSGTLVFLLPTLMNAGADVFGGFVASAVKKAFSYMGRFEITEILAWSVFYFLAGYYLSTTQLSAKRRKHLYILGICSLVATCLLNGVIGWKQQATVETYLHYNTANVAITAMAFFVWLKNKPFANSRVTVWMGHLSKYSLGVCAVHVMVLDILEEVGIHALSMPPVISIPVLTAVITAVSFLICYGIGKIPFVSKWIQ